MILDDGHDFVPPGRAADVQDPSGPRWGRPTSSQEHRKRTTSTVRVCYLNCYLEIEKHGKHGLLRLVALLGVLSTSVALPVSAGDTIATVVSPPRFEIANSRVSVWYEPERCTWGMAARDGSVALSNSTVGARLGDQNIQPPESSQCSAQREEGRDDLGDYVRLKVAYTGLPSLEELTWSATLRPDAPYSAFSLSTRAKPGAPGVLHGLQLVNLSGESSLQFGAEPDRWMYFCDAGHQGGTRVAQYFEGEQASYSSPATLMVQDSRAGRSLLLGWLSWAGSNPSVQLTGTKRQGLTGVSAQCSYNSDGLDRATSEPLLISFEPDPLVALEQYAQEVCRVNKAPVRKDTVLGWLSWYCSRLTMTEEFVLGNAKVIAERFRAYGIDTMQVDHGWEYRDVVGHWIVNERFPHGMKWLGEELKRLDLKLGIWIAASSVSEFAPFYSEHPQALIRNADGTPRVFVERWHWAPHGRVFSLDPTHPDAQQHYRDSLQALVDAGIRYYKVDFIGSAGDTAALFHDQQRPRGNPMLRYEMQQIRDAVGADSWLRYCSSPTNTYCGIVNIGGATMDIGNAVGNWDHLRSYHQQLATCWYKHRTFWHNEPDALIVGEGEENEARLRCAWMTLSGGAVALGDDLTRIAPERMVMIPKCLPSYDVAARPLDLFEQSPARIWDLTVRKPWDTYHVLGLFNLGQEEISVLIPLSRLGLEGVPVLAWEFWTQSPVSPGDQGPTVTIPPCDCRVVLVRQVKQHPQVLATDMHITMGGVELSEVTWDSSKQVLSGVALRAPGEKGTVFVHVPEGYEPIEGSVRADRILAVPLKFMQREVAWSVPFHAPDNGNGPS